MGRFVIFLALAGLVLVQASVPVTYYVDCQGQDASAGTSPGSAWRSVAKANAAPLLPGDSLLFRRGCVWSIPQGTSLVLSRSGTALAPITVGAYGQGLNPQIVANAGGVSINERGVTISGDYLSVADLRVSLAGARRDPTCLYVDGTAARVGWYAGVTVSGSHVLLDRMELEHLSVGIFLTYAGHDNAVAHSTFHDLDTFTRIYDPSGAFGSLGVLIQGESHEVAYNTFVFTRSATECLKNSVAYNYSAPFEVFNANGARIHHNLSIGSRKSLEVGKNIGESRDNQIAYNLLVSDQPNGRGPNLHGTDDFGPILDSQIVNNTVVLTGPGSQALLVNGGATGVVRNNILVGELKAAYLSAQASEDHNLYWDMGLTSDLSVDPCIQIAGQGCASLAGRSDDLDPVLDGSYRPRAGSPAIDAGVAGLWSSDLAGVPVQGAAPDIGAYEFSVPPTAISTLTPTPTSTSTPTPTPTVTPSPTPVVLSGCTITIRDPKHFEAVCP